MELAECPVVPRLRAFALQHMDLDARLAVGGRREHLALLGWDGGVAGEQCRHHATQRLDAERQRRNVQEQQILHFPGQHAGLDGCANRHHLVRIDTLVRLLAEQLLHDLLHLRHARGTADEHHLVDLPRLDPGVGQRLLHRSHGAPQEIVNELLELCAGELSLEVLGARLIGRDERQVDVGLDNRRQLHLRLLGGLLQALESHPILAQIDPLLALELTHDPIDDALVQVVAAKVRVAVGRFHLDHALAHFQNRDVERAAAEVEHGNRLVPLLVEPVGQRGRRRFVDDAHDLEPGDLPGILGRLPLRVVEVRRHGDDRLCDRLSEVFLRRLLQLLEHHGGNLRGRVIGAERFDLRRAIGGPADDIRHHLHFFVDFLIAATHEPLDGKDRVLGIGHRLAASDLPDQPFVTLGEGHDGGRQAAAFRIGDDGRLAALHDRHH